MQNIMTLYFRLWVSLILAFTFMTACTNQTDPSGPIPDQTLDQPLGDTADQTLVDVETDAYQPAFIKNVTYTDTEIRLSGTAKPEAIIVILMNGERIRNTQVDKDGIWGVAITYPQGQILKFDVTLFIDETTSIPSDETLILVPKTLIADYEAASAGEARASQSNLSGNDEDGTELGAPSSPLIFIGVPGGPSRIIQSPFRDLPQSGALELGAIEYDRSGGVIFSGVSDIGGRVRIFANDIAIGEAQIASDGRWFFIAASALPDGAYNIKAELMTAEGVAARIDVPFRRLTDNDISPYISDVGDTHVFITDNYWQVRRVLSHGGVQYTVIFSSPPPRP